MLIINTRDEERLAHLENYLVELDHYKNLKLVTPAQYERELNYVKKEIEKIKTRMQMINGESVFEDKPKDFDALVHEAIEGVENGCNN